MPNALTTGALFAGFFSIISSINGRFGTSAVAVLVAERREFGLNWRIDAAKDVADMDFVREADPPDRAGRFVREMDFVKSFWADMTQAIRKESPKAVVIPEWTDFELLSDSKTAVDVARSLYEDNTFSGTPNMQYLYSPAHQLFHYAGRPDEFGASQMPPRSAPPRMSDG